MINQDYDYIIKNLASLKNIALTNEMIESIPKIDIHVHLPGTISPKTAWHLGVRNGFIKTSSYSWERGPSMLSVNNPHEHYIDIFKNNEQITLDAHGIPEHLEYNIVPNSFKNFDAVMATVQGHRHPPGGIQNESDLHFVFQAYLEDCIKQNIVYTEIQQNIKIAHQLYPKVNPYEARQKLYAFFEKVAEEYQVNGIYIRFLHCFNKTQTASVSKTTRERAIEAADWLREAQQFTKNIFVGVEAAGHEKDESGWPSHLKEGYEAVKALGLGCEAHGGEGIGFEHMLDIIRVLPVTRIAHGFQVIEDEAAILEVKQKNITLVMSPMINLFLGACISSTINGEKHKKYITSISDHPFFTLLRKYDMNIALCSDNPEMAGMPMQALLKILAGLSNEYTLDSTEPITTGELLLCLLNGIKSAFCEEVIKTEYLNKLAKWCNELSATI